MKSSATILITGANGYIGSHVANSLYDLNYKIIACDFKKDKLNKNIDFIKTDILKESNNVKLYEIFNHPTHLIHFAWQDGFNHYANSHIDNITKHFYFLKNMIDSGINSITVMGTVHEIGYYEGKINENTPCNPLSYYGIAKNTLRQLLFAYAKDKNVSIKWLRAYYITGDDCNNHSVFTRLLEAAKNKQEEFPFTKGTNQFDFINIKDLSKMIISASLQNKTEGIINVCSGKPITLKDKVEDFIKEHNLNIKLKYGAFPSRKYDSPIVYGDNTKIQKILEEFND